MPPKLAQHFRLAAAPTKTILEIETIHWRASHTPYTKWIPYRTWSAPPTEADLAAVQEDALNDPKFFQKCSLCLELHPTGRTVDAPPIICHECAQTKRGIIF